MDNLEELYLSENEIKDVSQLKNMPKLKKLDLNTNKIESLKDANLDLPALEHFDIGANAITSVDTIATLAKFTQLKNFVAAGNPFADELGDKLKGELLF
jgi:internalin A